MGKLNLRFGKKTKPTGSEHTSPTSPEPPKLSIDALSTITASSLSPVTPKAQPEKEANLLDEIFHQLNSGSTTKPTSNTTGAKAYGNSFDTLLYKRHKKLR
jgi:hypothetical protein